VQRKIGTPVVTELSIAEGGLDIEPGTVMPARLPDLMAGTPIVIRGRCASGRRRRARAARRRSHRRALAGAQCARARRCGGPEAALWARAAIRDLEDTYAIGGADPSTINRIVDISKRFSVLSRFTAFLAVDRSEVVNRGGKLHRATQAVEPASGWDMLGAGDDQAKEKSGSLSRRSLVQASMPAAGRRPLRRAGW
jgi:Ca-activated chloride channel family protein